MLYRERASVVATLAVLGLILSVFLDIPTRTFDLTVLGSPLRVSLSQMVLMAALLVGITCAGTDAIVRSHPAALRIEARYSFVTWTLPGLTVLLATVLLPQAPTRLYQLAGLVTTGLLLILVISAEYYTVAPTDRQVLAARSSLNVWAYLLALVLFILILYSAIAGSLIGLVAAGLLLILVISAVYYTVDPIDRQYLTARFALNAWAYLLALVLFILIYSAKARSLISATGVTLVSTLLALEFLRSAGRGFRRTALYAAIAGLCTGEIIWAMNYWRISGVTGGVILLLGFYVVTGLANEQLQGRLNRRVVVEYAAVALIGLVVLLLIGSFRL